MTSQAAAWVERAREAGAPAARRHAAFEQLVRSFEGMALACAVRLLRDADEAGDAVQDAFLAAWSKLSQVRTPAAFGGWLKRLVSTECHRRLRQRRAVSRLDRGEVDQPLGVPPWAVIERCGSWGPLARALTTLTEADRRALVLFYVEGYTLQEIAAMECASPPSIGKRLYTARLKLRRALPATVHADALRVRARGVRPGPDALDAYVGVYRFDKRPGLVVEISRSGRGDALISESQGQRHLLHYVGDDTLATQSFDGEGRFQRDRSGRITRFVYYEFGARLGVARRIPSHPLEAAACQR
jgi:DNA-directed RNA polymerase specialized sigma24 family protein